MSDNRITKDDWGRLRIAEIEDWTLIVAGDQHTLGSVIIFPPGDIEASIAHLPDTELLKFGKIARIVENLLAITFGAEWFNYSQAGNRIKKLHILIQPRYSQKIEFHQGLFLDVGWPGPVRILEPKKLPSKEIVFATVQILRQEIKDIDTGGMRLHIYTT